MGRYSWDDDSGTKTPEDTTGYDYKSARAAYRSVSAAASAAQSRRTSYNSTNACRQAKHPVDRGGNVHTESAHPVVVCVDDTGSFLEEVKIILEKLPLLGKEVERYAPDYEISFSLVGDVDDQYPLQVRDFAKNEELDKHIQALWVEGGGCCYANYDLAAWYYLHHCEMPNAVKPIFIWVLDSSTRPDLKMEQVKKYIGDVLSNDVNAINVLKSLMEKFSVYVIYKGNESSGTVIGNISFWNKEVYDPQHVMIMTQPRDIVEMIIGIVAAEMGKYQDFTLRSSIRHTDNPGRISRLNKSMRSIVAAQSMLGEVSPGTLEVGGKSMKSKKLI